jgi:hypothetical protein
LIVLSAIKVYFLGRRPIVILVINQTIQMLSSLFIQLVILITVKCAIQQMDGKPSSFNHDVQYFRIYSGKHSYSKGRWRLCVDCHLSAPNSFQSYSCTTNCHNNRTKLDTEHRNVPGYIYDNQACYSCHKSV